MQGTSLVRFRRQFIDRLTGLVPNASYQSPMTETDMIGEDGSGVAVWWSDDVEASTTVEVVVGGGQVWFDERYVTELRIQGLGLDTDDDQYACDQRANEAFGYALQLLTCQGVDGYDLPDLDDDLEGIEVFDYTLDGWSWRGGVIGTNQRAGRFEVRIAVHGRVKIGASQ